jgi:phosphatidylinositol alpha-mannosyltransferase
VLKRWFRRLHGKIAVSKPAMEFASGYFPGYYNIIPNGVDVAHFSPDVSPVEEFCDGKLNILFVSRLEKRKGLNYLLEAFKQVKREIPNSRLIIVGPGTRLRRGYERGVRRSGLQDVVFTGLIPYEELPRYYKTADVFCAPATGRESFGIILLEAMAVGKPVVASKIEGYASVLGHNVDGLLVPPADKDMLARALLSLLTDESLRREMGARGRAKALDYSWERIARNVLSYYMRVLSQPPWNKRFPELEATVVSV